MIHRVILFILIGSSVCASEICFDHAAELYSVPKVILKSIAVVESGLNPLAVNIRGQSYFPDTEEDGYSLLNANRSKSADIGIMQVNTWWFDRYGYDKLYGFNACWNIHFGASILSYELQRSGGDIWQAVGRYHSPNAARGYRYAAKVAEIMGC